MATMAMINAAALPNVAFSSPPTASPVWWERCSVALPSQLASGRIARQAARKMSVCDSGWVNCSQALSGTKMSSQFSDGRSSLDIRRFFLTGRRLALFTGYDGFGLGSPAAEPEAARVVGGEVGDRHLQLTASTAVVAFLNELARPMVMDG